MRRVPGIYTAVAFVSLIVACGGGDHREPPDTQIDSGPKALTNDSHAIIAFTPLGNANTFFCTLDNGTPSQCLSPFVTDVVDGTHTFSVAAALNDAVDETPATHTWTVDTVKPETTLVQAPPAVDNTPTPSMTFTGSDNRGDVAGFECAVDAAQFADCVSPLQLAALAEGDHTFRVRA